MVPGDDTRSPRWVAALVAFGVALGALGLGLWASRDRRRTLQEWSHRLESAADGRQQAVQVWLAERLADVTLHASSPIAMQLVRAGGERAHDERAAELERLLGRIASTYRNIGVWVIDARDVVVASGHTAAPDAAVLSAARRARIQAAPAIELQPSGKMMRLAVAAPMLDADGTGIGAIVSETDPELFLYPLLLGEPLPSRTVETFLVEVVDGRVVPLSPRRRSAAMPMIGGADAVRHQEGALVATRPIRDTRWRLIAIVDEGEALAGHAARFWSAAFAGLAALAALAAGAAWIWARQRVDIERYRGSLAQLLEHASDAIIFVSEGGQILHANRKAAELYGYTRAELETMSIPDLRADHDPAEVRRIADALIQEGSLIFDATQVRKDGSRVVVEVSAATVEYSGQRMFLSIARDVTGRKLAEGLRAGELEVLEMIARGAPLAETLATLVNVIEGQSENARASILLVDERGRLRHAAAPRLPQEFLDAVDGQPIGPYQGSCGTAAFRGESVIATDVMQDPLWADFRDLARRFGFKACWSVPVLAPDGLVLGTIALYQPRPPSADEMRVVRRATHLAAVAIGRQQAEDALRRSEGEFRVVFESAFIGIALLGPDGRPIRSNPALERFLGYTAEELAVLPFHELTHPEDVERDAALHRALVEGGRDAYEIDKRFVRKDGEIVEGHLMVSRVAPAGPEGPVLAIGLVEDVTEKRRLLKAVDAAQKMEAVGRLAGGIAHDFNNVLGVILGQGQLVLRALPAEHPARTRLEGMLAAADRAASLTRQLLAFSRRQAFEVKVLDLNEVVSDIIKVLGRLVGEDVVVRFEPGPHLGRVRADRSQLDQVFMNLAVNARDAMSNGGFLTIETANVDLDLEFVRTRPGAQPGAHVALIVRDTGCGMPPEVRTRAFEPFFTTKETGKGTGLGLATVYGIVKQSGGYVDVDSEPGRGTTFSIYLPRVEDDSPLEEAVDDVVAPRGSECVLVVEDERSLREIVCEQMEGLGYRVLTAASAEEALRVAESHDGPIDLLLTDVVMPDVNGRELARRLTATRPEMKVLYMSGYTDEVITRHGVLAAGTFLISKPFTAAALARRLRAVIDADPPGAAVGGEPRARRPRED